MIRNVIWHLVIGFALFTLYLLDNNEHDLGINAKFIVIFSGSLKIGYLAFGYAAIYWLWIKRVLNVQYYEQYRYLLELAYFPWSIYCLIKFFDSDNDTRDHAVLLYICMLYLMIEAFLILFLNCLVFTAIIIGLILICWIVRSQSQLDEELLQRNNEISNMISHLDVLNVTGRRFEEGEYWWIWYEVFDNQIEVIRLPWNRKHYFHKQWILKWIKNSCVCPLWKTEITLEILEQIDHDMVSETHSRNGRYGTLNNKDDNEESKSEDLTRRGLERTREEIKQ